MHLRGFGVIIALLVISATFACAQADPAQLKVGDAAPAFSGKSINGEQISLENYKGKVVLIDFWATFCPPCVSEVPNVLAVYNKYKDQGFEVIGISLDREKSKLEAFVKEKSITWPQIFDEDGKIAGTYGVPSIPTTCIINKEGKIAAVGILGDELDPAIEAALRGDVPKPSGVEIGDLAPVFSEKDTNGEHVALESYKGKVVLLNFWVARHESSVKEVKNIAAAYNKFKDKGFAAIGVDLSKEQGILNKFLEENKDVSWPQIYDPGIKFKLTLQYKLKYAPCTFIISKDGKVLSVNPAGADLEKAIERAFNGKTTEIAPPTLIPATGSESNSNAD